MIPKNSKSFFNFSLLLDYYLKNHPKIKWIYQMFALMNHKKGWLLLFAQISFCFTLTAKKKIWCKIFQWSEGLLVNCATSIQKAIETCFLSGYRKVVFPAGKYLNSNFFSLKAMLFFTLRLEQKYLPVEIRKTIPKAMYSTWKRGWKKPVVSN